MQANIFFFITSLAVIVVTIGVIILIIKLRKLFDAVHGLVDKVRHATDIASEETKDLLEDIKQNPLFRLLFPRRRVARMSDAGHTAKPPATRPRRRV